MNDTRERVCRLCLRMLTNHFKVIEEDTIKLFDIIHLEISLSISEGPVMCENCDRNVQQSFALTTLCNRGKQKNFLTSNIVLDSKDVYLDEEKKVNVKNDMGCNICQLCKQFMAKDCGTALDTLTKDMTWPIDALQKYFSEMNLVIGGSSLFCPICIESLERYINFMRNCWKVEENIKKYCEKRGTNARGQIELNDVLYFESQNIPYNNSRCVDLDIIKLEADLIESRGDEKVNVKDENEIEMKQEIDFSGEQTEMTEDDISDGFQEREDSPASEIKYSSLLRLASEVTYGQHKLTHKIASEFPVYKCCKSTHEARSRSSLAYHMRIHNNSSEVYKCEACTYKTMQKPNFNAHLLTHKDLSETLTYKCNKCTYKTKQKYPLTVHMLNHKDLSEIPVYECELCSYRTRRKSNLPSHMLTHRDPSEITTYKCNTCTYEAKRKSNLVTHMLRHKDPSERAIYTCEICSFGTNKKFSLNRHMLLHNAPVKARVYKCDLCTYETEQKLKFTGHILSHGKPSNKTSYKCDVCGHEVKRIYDLRAHLLTHNNPADVTVYKCEVCSYRTLRKHHFKTHMVTHEGKQ